MRLWFFFNFCHFVCLDLFLVVLWVLLNYFSSKSLTYFFLDLLLIIAPGFSSVIWYFTVYFNSICLNDNNWWFSRLSHENHNCESDDISTRQSRSIKNGSTKMIPPANLFKVVMYYIYLCRVTIDCAHTKNYSWHCLSCK